MIHELCLGEGIASLAVADEPNVKEKMLGERSGSTRLMYDPS